MRSQHGAVLLTLLVFACSKATGDASVESPSADGVTPAEDTSVAHAEDGRYPDAAEDAQNHDAGPATIVAPKQPAPEVWSNLPLPKAEDGRQVLVDLPGIKLLIDPAHRTPITALAECAMMITACFRPPAHSLDDCVAVAPDCATDTPWTEEAACCPSACRKAYATERAAGLSEEVAFDASYFHRGGCFPGIDAPAVTP